MKEEREHVTSLRSRINNVPAHDPHIMSNHTSVVKDAALSHY